MLWEACATSPTKPKYMTFYVLHQKQASRFRILVLGGAPKHVVTKWNGTIVLDHSTTVKVHILEKLLTLPATICSSFLEDTKNRCKIYNMLCSPKTARVRGARFTLVEDQLLPKRCIKVSKNTVAGSDQIREMFYKATNEYYKSTKTAFCMSWVIKSVKRRVRKILPNACVLIRVLLE